MCPKFPNAPTSAAAFAQRLSSQRLSSQRSSPSGLRPAAHWHLPHRLSSQRSSPSCTIGIYPIGYRPSGSAPLQRHRPSVSIAPVLSATSLRELPRAQKCRFCARKCQKWGSRRQKAHKNPDFVLGTPENGGSGRQKRTKTSILCSKCLKTWVPEAKKAQKPRFCARNARKRGFRRPKKHKNLDFVLGKKGIGIRERGN